MECEALERLVDDVSAARSRVLVLRGEAGIGKSALLDHLEDCDFDGRVVRSAGVESEMELPYAGLHQLLTPLLQHRDGLPATQRGALETALGLGESAAPPDRFLTSLGALSLIADAAERTPLLYLVDDVQWLDRASVQVLAFVARRVLAESVGMVFAVREPSSSNDLDGLPDLRIAGLDDLASRAVLAATTVGRLDPAVLDRIVTETRGNPLALREMPRGLTAAELAGGFGLPATSGMESAMEQVFMRRIDALPRDTQQLLLVAATDPLGDANLMWRAASELQVDPEAAMAAEESGLVTIDTRVSFSHPLVRSAIYRNALLGDRREAHRALALATDADVDPDRRAWHRASAAAAPDESIAGDLDRSAARARRRGGVAAAAAFQERAAELTPDPARRGARALAAAHAKFEAADLDGALRLLATAEISPLAALDLAKLPRLRAQIVFAQRRGSDAPPLLLAAAQRLEALDPALARETYLEALGAAMVAGRLGGSTDVRRVAEVAGAAPPAVPARPIDVLLDGIALLLTRDHEVGMPALRQALEPFREAHDPQREQMTQWLLQTLPTAQEAAVHHLWDFDAWDRLSTSAVQLARDSGALAFLPIALMYRAGAEMHVGNFARAATLMEEADSITTVTGYAPVSYARLVEAGWRGDEDRTLAMLATEVPDAHARGEGIVLVVAGLVTAVLYNGLARYDSARDAAREACAADDFSFVGWSLAELVEAAVRSGSLEEAAWAMERLDARTSAAGTDWALGVRARCKGLLSEGADADRLYAESVDRLSTAGVKLQEARSRLVYGEWLRRENRRVDARHQLRAAHEMFSAFGAEAFAERARREIAATGATVRSRSDAKADVLTAQESAIADLAAEGHTNSEIGSQLFISARTVEYHLHKVFTKLGISSRRELRRGIARPGDAATLT